VAAAQSVTSHLKATTATVTRPEEKPFVAMEADLLDPQSFSLYCEAQWNGLASDGSGIRYAVALSNSQGFPFGLRIEKAGTLVLNWVGSSTVVGGGIERGAARIVSETIALSNGGGFYTSGITEIPALGVIKPQLRIGCSRTGDQINGFVTEILIYSGTPLTDDQITAPAL
jgi:hypothetical protein